MAHTKVPPSASLSGIQDNTPLMKLMKCVKDTAHCTRLFKSFERWFNEKRTKGLTFSYRFTGLESKRFSWHFSSMVHEVLAFPTLSKGSVLQIHCLAFIGLQLRDAASIYSRVELDRSQVDDLKTLCQHYFNTYSLLLAKVNPTIWTIGYAIPQHTNQLFDELGYGLGLNSMQGREAKHIQLAKYTENTCNVQKHLRWWIVFRHEFVCQIWLREMDPFSTTYEENRTESFIPKKVQESDKAMCYCGMPKEAADEGCRICTSDLLIAIKGTAVSGKISPQIKTFVDLPPFANGKK